MKRPVTWIVKVVHVATAALHPPYSLFQQHWLLGSTRNCLNCQPLEKATMTDRGPLDSGVLRPTLGPEPVGTA